MLFGDHRDADNETKWLRIYSKSLLDKRENKRSG